MGQTDPKWAKPTRNLPVTLFNVKVPHTWHMQRGDTVLKSTGPARLVRETGSTNRNGPNRPETYNVTFYITKQGRFKVSVDINGPDASFTGKRATRTETGQADPKPTPTGLYYKTWYVVATNGSRRVLTRETGHTTRNGPSRPETYDMTIF
jgi:hypothetical protein